MRKNLTEMQTKFLDALFHEEVRGNVRKAMRIAGYSDETPLHTVTGPLAEEIFERTQAVLAANAAAAAMNMSSFVHDPDALASSTHMKALTELLDRTGHVKKEKIEVSGTGGGGLFILPEKAKIEED